VNPPENLSENPLNSAAERQSVNWDIQNAPKNYLSLVLTQAGSAFFAFASVWLITKTLGLEDYGGIVAVIAASQVAQVLVNWTSVAVIRFGVDEFIETEKIARAFWLRLFILLPNLLLVLLTANLWFPPLADWLKLSADAFWLVFLHFAAIALWIHVQYSLQAVKMPRLQGGLLMIERALIFSGLLIFSATGKLDTVSAVICYAVAPLAATLTGFWILRNFIFVSFTMDTIFWRKIVIFSLPLIPFTLTSYLSSGADAVFISKFLSTRDLGIYSVATQISGIALQLPTLANSLLLPLFVSLQKENKTNRLQHYFKHTFPTLILFWGLFSTVAAVTGYFLIPVFFGEEFTQAIRPLWILLAASVLSLPPLVGYGALSNATSTTYISMFAAAFAALANIGFNFLLIPVFGMEGCAWATAIMYLITTLVFVTLLRRIIEIPVSWLFWAIVPGVGGAIGISLTGNPYWALTICVALTVFVAYLHRTSIKETIIFLKNLRKL
jgi:O-antigen/teichoic acid export membrane protein